MVSLFLVGGVMLGFMAAFLHSRKVTESNVLHAAASSLVYGIIEQIKGMDYATLLPNTAPDPFDPLVTASTPAYYPNVRVRINPSLTVWLRPVYTPTTVDGATGRRLHSRSRQRPRSPPAPSTIFSEVCRFPPLRARAARISR